MESKTKRVKAASASPCADKLTSFWTACPNCKNQLEYLRKYLKGELFCKSCREVFIATEMPEPSTFGEKSSGVHPWAEVHRDLKIRQARYKKSPAGPCESVPVAGKAAGLSNGEQVTSDVQPPCDKSKRGRDEATEAALREDVLRGEFCSSSKAVTGMSGGAQKFSNPGLCDIDLNKLPSEASDESSTSNSYNHDKKKETLESILSFVRIVAKKRRGQAGLDNGK